MANNWLLKKIATKQLFMLLCAAAACLVHIPQLAAWQRHRKHAVCLNDDLVIALARTKYGKSVSYYWIFNRFMSPLVAYVLPMTYILTQISMKASKSSQSHKRQLSSLGIHSKSDSHADIPLKAESLQHDKHIISEWILKVVVISYLPVALYSLLERLQESGASLGLPKPGIAYILHLSVALLKIVVYLGSPVFKASLLAVEELGDTKTGGEVSYILNEQHCRHPTV